MLSRLGTFSGTLFWIPGPTGITGNELADKAARDSDHIENIKLSYDDIRIGISKYVETKWGEKWRSCAKNKLHNIHTATID